MPSSLQSVRPPVPMSTPKLGDLPVIRQLSQELFALRNEITASVDKHNGIVDQLQSLKAAYIPSKISVPGLHGAKIDSRKINLLLILHLVTDVLNQQRRHHAMTWRKSSNPNAKSNWRWRKN